MATHEVRAEPMDGPAAAQLLAELDADLDERYGSSETVEGHPAQFLPPDGLFLVLRADGQPQACGGYRRLDATTAEIKRMYVRHAARGRGYGRIILARLETAAAEAGYTQVWLETGVPQPEAITLYESSGYAPVAPFGQFAGYPDQRCYGKVLAAKPSKRAPLS